MPTYRYECGRCGTVHEIFHSISDDPKERCPDCGGKLVRLIGRGGGVLLKGSGFYTTDYRPDSYHS
ncbi:MAG TPA: FmdB family zinc ribbon protein, partial [bacterium]|nr:FmdB family zinc ribbon protein [bacterium]